MSKCVKNDLLEIIDIFPSLIPENNFKKNANQNIKSKYKKLNSKIENVIIDNKNIIMMKNSNLYDFSQQIMIKNTNYDKSTDKFKCEKCNKVFTSNQNCKYHSMVCGTKKNPYECHICHKIFTHRTSKYKHIKVCEIKNIYNDV